MSSRAPSISPGHVEADRPLAAARTLIAVLQAYRVGIRPVLPPSCRFAPSCSTFAIEALRRHGALRGLALTARRLAHCHPWHVGGFDPVPDRED